MSRLNGISVAHYKNIYRLVRMRRIDCSYDNLLLHILHITYNILHYRLTSLFLQLITVITLIIIVFN